MNAFKSYIRPNKGGAKTAPPPPVQMEKVSDSSGGRTPATYASPRGSRPPSIHPNGDFRNNGMAEVNEIKSVVAMNWVYQLQNEHMWNSGSLGEGVIMRKAPRQFIACPPDLTNVRGGLFDAASELNSRVRKRPLLLRF